MFGVYLLINNVLKCANAIGLRTKSIVKHLESGANNFLNVAPLVVTMTHVINRKPVEAHCWGFATSKTLKTTRSRN